jgi:glycosyltransferase involved in cell wall biosynthesis
MGDRDPRPRVLYVGPDVPGGMRTVMRGISSSLSERFRLDPVRTHTGTGAAERLRAYLAALAAITWWSLRRRGRVVHVHATVRGSMYRKAICVVLAKALGRRVLLHVHSGPGDIETYRAGMGRLAAAAVGFALRRADVVLAVSSASAARLESAFGVDGIEVLPNAAPPRREQPAASAAPDPRAAFLGGFANPVKGGAEIVATIRLLEPGRPRLDLAGPGTPPTDAAELIDSRPDVSWHGWLEAPQLAQLLDECGIFVLASTSEGLPMVLMEAMSRGMAIVATAVGGVPDVVADGEQALVVPPGEPPALAAALTRLADDGELRRRLGEAAWRRAADFDPVRIGERIEQIYRELGAAPS